MHSRRWLRKLAGKIDKNIKLLRIFDEIHSTIIETGYSRKNSVGIARNGRILKENQKFDYSRTRHSAAVEATSTIVALGTERVNEILPHPHK
jgi:hypothetical protein